jgi:hypothetical protein
VRCNVVRDKRAQGRLCFDKLLLAYAGREVVGVGVDLPKENIH